MKSPPLVVPNYDPAKVPQQGADVSKPAKIEAAHGPNDPKVITLGKSVGGKPITLYLFGDTAVGPANTILIFGGIHGSEPASAGVCNELVTLLRADPTAWAGKCVAVLPEANPDGLANKRRTNANLVDLNRNFPAANWKKTRRSGMFGGDAAASQPETKVLVDLVEKMKPARITAVHSMDDPCNNFDGPAEPFAKLMAVHNGYAVKSNIGYPTPGSFGSWAGIDRSIPVITLELPNSKPAAKSWPVNRPALLAFIRADRREIAAAAAAKPAATPKGPAKATAADVAGQ